MSGFYKLWVQVSTSCFMFCSSNHIMFYVLFIKPHHVTNNWRTPMQSMCIWFSASCSLVFMPRPHVRVGSGHETTYSYASFMSLTPLSHLLFSCSIVAHTKELITVVNLLVKLNWMQCCSSTLVTVSNSQRVWPSLSSIHSHSKKGSTNLLKL